uniref:Uncharacterized protein n=1 Tax=viral metagenome TaxID=1070528 RepID=A0A6M3LVP8_9ZZZZ
MKDKVFEKVWRKLQAELTKLPKQGVYEFTPQDLREFSRKVWELGRGENEGGACRGGKTNHE